MFGSVPEGSMVRRAGAKAGDRVFVSGTIGDAALGLAVRRGKDFKLADAQRQHLLGRYLLPQPRNALAEAVRTHAPPPWMSRTGWLAISPSSAASPR